MSVASWNAVDSNCIAELGLHSLTLNVMREVYICEMLWGCHVITFSWPFPLQGAEDNGVVHPQGDLWAAGA